MLRTNTEYSNLGSRIQQALYERGIVAKDDTEAAKRYVQIAIEALAALEESPQVHQLSSFDVEKFLAELHLENIPFTHRPGRVSFDRFIEEVTKSLRVTPLKENFRKRLELAAQQTKAEYFRMALGAEANVLAVLEIMLLVESNKFGITYEQLVYAPNDIIGRRIKEVSEQAINRIKTQQKEQENTAQQLVLLGFMWAIGRTLDPSESPNS